MNLGQDPLFPDSADDVNPIVMNGISTGTSNSLAAEETISNKQISPFQIWKGLIW